MYHINCFFSCISKLSCFCVKGNTFLCTISGCWRAYVDWGEIGMVRAIKTVVQNP